MVDFRFKTHAEEAKELGTTEILARWGDDVVALARSRGMPDHLAEGVRRAAIAMLGPILGAMVREMKPDVFKGETRDG